MTFRIELDQFRVFAHTGEVSIRPITLLTGGNSAGKSSFLAALRYMSDVDFLSATTPSFNKDPFYLGSYEQIAHYRGGKAGRSKTFSFTYKGPSGKPPTSRRSTSQNVEITICFGKKLSQPCIKQIVYKGERSSFKLDYSDDWKAVNATASLEKTSLSGSMEADEFISAERMTQNPAIVVALADFILSNVADETVRARENVIEISQITQDLRGAISSVPRTSYVGAPVRSRPSRTYDPVDVAQQSEGAHVPSQLAQLSRTNPQQWDRIRESLIEFGKDSSLFSDIEIRSLGKSDSDPFQLNVTINGPKRNIIDVGYGVSQALPIIFELINRERNTLFLAQQPEVHLHPEAQAALGSLIARESQRVPGYIVAETHSDFLIDRIRRHIRDGMIKKEEVSLLYFSRNELSAQIIGIELDDNGDIIHPPQSYRDFFFKEEMENLGINVFDN